MTGGAALTRSVGLVSLLVLLLGASVFWKFWKAASNAEDNGITLSDMQVEVEKQQLHLSADARITLPATVEAGLDNGVPLTFVLSLQVLQPRTWWLDRTIVDVQRRYTLTYYELTRHYRVRTLETDVNRNFRSLSSALAGLGELSPASFELDTQQLRSMASDDILAILDMSLLQSALPLPLQPIIRSSWSLKSPEYRWSVI